MSLNLRKYKKTKRDFNYNPKENIEQVFQNLLNGIKTTTKSSIR